MKLNFVIQNRAQFW